MNTNALLCIADTAASCAGSSLGSYQQNFAHGTEVKVQGDALETAVPGTQVCAVDNGTL